MDRAIPEEELRKRRWRRLALGVGVTGVVAVLIILVSGWIRPTVARTQMRTAIVEKGSIEATVSANGRVVPSQEQLLTSPIDSRVVRILRQPGDALEPGETILELDAGETQLALEKLADRIAIQRNARERTQIELEGTQNDLRGRAEIKNVELRAAEQEVTRNQTLFDMGLVTETILESFKIESERARIELRQLEESVVQAQEEVRVQLEGLDLEIAVLEKDLTRERNRLERSRPSADEAGVLTWVVPRVGTAVRRGDELARIADLRSFRVEATLSDVHAATLSLGQPARIRVGDEFTDGVVTQVRPTVENGIITCEITLDRPDHPNLRHNLRVDVHIVTDRRESALVVRRGYFPVIDGTETVYLVRDDVAIRTSVRFGISNFKQYEVIEGLEPGDEVVLSDMSDYTHLEEVSIQ